MATVMGMQIRWMVLAGVVVLAGCGASPGGELSETGRGGVSATSGGAAGTSAHGGARAMMTAGAGGAASSASGGSGGGFALTAGSAGTPQIAAGAGGSVESGGSAGAPAGAGGEASTEAGGAPQGGSSIAGGAGSGGQMSSGGSGGSVTMASGWTCDSSSGTMCNCKAQLNVSTAGCPVEMHCCIASLYFAQCGCSESAACTFDTNVAYRVSKCPCLHPHATSDPNATATCD